ncbi:uncharacterized protein TNCV_4001081 [Trichonephila clavipes]|nr:uncharacterized protein TNCV_4001081 [Trichonephila clavipes]
MEVAVFSFGEASCLVVVQTFIFDARFSQRTLFVTRFAFFHMCVFFRGAMGLQFLFMDARQCTMSSHSSCRTVAWRGRRLAARTLPPVTIRELRLALQDEWAAMPQQLIDTLILSMGRRCETCLVVREIISPTKRPDVSCWTPITGMFWPSVALHSMLLFQSSFFIPLISLLNDIPIDVACHRYILNMQVSSGTKNNSSPNEPSCTIVTVSFNGTWRSPY